MHSIYSWKQKLCRHWLPNAKKSISKVNITNILILNRQDSVLNMEQIVHGFNSIQIKEKNRF